MFSTIPRIGTLTCWNIVTALRASSSETSDGVVTTIAPVTGALWINESCTSPVPSGLSPGLKKPIDMILTPYCCSGCMRSPKAIGVSLIPIISGTLGPYTSASIRPTLWPSAARPTARLTATVVLPTPPFPDPTAIRFLTPGIGSLGNWPGWLGDIVLWGNRRLRGAAFLGVALPAHRVQPAQFLAQGFHALGVDHFVRLAEVIQLLKLPVRPMPELGTSPVTDGLVLADLALGMGDGLLRREGVAPRAARDFAPRVHGHVAQF